MILKANTNFAPAARLDWLYLLLLFLFAFIPVLLTANDYGPTYDEPFYASGGAKYAAWWARIFHGDLVALRAQEITTAWRFNHEHPPLQKCSIGFSQKWLGGILPGLTAIRLPSALWFALAVCAVYLALLRTFGRTGAVFGALALATMPRIFSHAHLAALDMPIMAWFFIAAMLCAEALHQNKWPWAIMAGIAFGLALLAKVNAFFLPVLFLPWALIWRRYAWPKLIAILAIGPLIFWVGWPWLWVNTIPHLREYFAFHFHHAAYNVWYLGKLYQYAPWHYPFMLTAITTPILLLVLSLVGLAYCLRRQVQPEAILLVLGLVITLAPNALPGSPKYNGVRLFLPAFPFLAALAGVGFNAICNLKIWSNKFPQLLCVLLGALLLAPGIRGLAMTHPYQLAYYNQLVGGTAGATRRGFETIYWGQVLQEAVPLLNALPIKNPKVLVIPKGVIYLLEFQQQAGALRADVQFTGDERDLSNVDYIMFQCMQSEFSPLAWQLYREAKPVSAVRLGETPLLVIYEHGTM